MGMTKILISLISLSALCNASPIYYLTSGQTQAQTQIDVAHTSTWLLDPNVNFDFAGGLFTMKAGGSIADDITLSLYAGSDNSGTLLGSVTLTPLQFCAQA